MDYLRRTEAVLRRLQRNRAHREKAEARATQQAAEAARPRQRPGRPPIPGGPNSYVRPADRMARAERAGQLQYQPSRPTFAHEINLAEPGAGVAHARRMLDRIVAINDRGGWTTSERVMLWRAKQTWQRRVDGKDARYLAVGNKRGRLTASQQRQVQAFEDAMAIQSIVAEAVAEVQRAVPGIGGIE